MPAARIVTTDLVLEPSAGTGLLAAFARRAGARLVLNDCDPARAEMLAAAFPGCLVTRHDAELIHDLLDPSIRPTAVLINPPFSRSVGRRGAALRHIRNRQGPSRVDDLRKATLDDAEAQLAPSARTGE